MSKSTFRAHLGFDSPVSSDPGFVEPHHCHHSNSPLQHSPSSNLYQRPSTESLLLSVGPYSQLSLRRQRTNSYSSHYRRRLTENQYLRASSYDPNFMSLSYHADAPDFSDLTPPFSSSKTYSSQPTTPTFHNRSQTSSPTIDEPQRFTPSLSARSNPSNSTLFETHHSSILEPPLPLPFQRRDSAPASSNEFFTSVAHNHPNPIYQSNPIGLISSNHVHQKVPKTPLEGGLGIHRSAAKKYKKHSVPDSNSPLNFSSHYKNTLVSRNIPIKKLQPHSSFPNSLHDYTTFENTVPNRNTMLCQSANYATNVDSGYLHNTRLFSNPRDRSFTHTQPDQVVTRVDDPSVCNGAGNLSKRFTRVLQQNGHNKNHFCRQHIDDFSESINPSNLSCFSSSSPPPSSSSSQPVVVPGNISSLSGSKPYIVYPNAPLSQFQNFQLWHSNQLNILHNRQMVDSVQQPYQSMVSGDCSPLDFRKSSNLTGSPSFETLANKVRNQNYIQNNIHLNGMLEILKKMKKSTNILSVLPVCRKPRYCRLFEFH